MDIVRVLDAVRRRLAAPRDPWTFFALTYGLSWAFWVPAALWGAPEPAGLTLALHYLGGLMPLVVALTLTIFSSQREARRDYWQRVTEWRRIGPGWVAVVLVTVPALNALGIAADRLCGGGGGRIAPRFLERPWSVLPFALFTMLFGPLPEELAWRGVALDRLQARWDALRSTLLLGTAWTVWHLPLFGIEGSYQHSLIGSVSFWLFMADKIPQSVVMTWVYNHNRRSTWSAVLIHFMVNLVGELVELTARAECWYIAAWIGMAIAVVVLGGLGRRPAEPSI